MRRRWIELLWGAFAAANIAVIVVATRWETIPFHLVWVSLSLLYGFRSWSLRGTVAAVSVVTVGTAAALVFTVVRGHEQLDEVAEVPLMAAMFVAMMWHARGYRSAMDEVRRLADSEHRLLERQREFIRDASHELRTPITVARGHAELIARGSEVQTAEDARVLLDELGKLERLSERLLILATAEGPSPLSLAPVRAEEFVSALARRWMPTAVRRWEVAVDAEGVVLADGERLALALDALVENAVRYTEDGDRIRIGARRDGEDLLIEVADSGPGIPAEQLSRVFERFARADPGRSRRAGGTGLGLSIAKAIVEAHGGEVSVESEPGRRTAFRVRLPGLRGEGRAVPATAGRISSLTRPAGAAGTAAGSAGPRWSRG